MDGAHPLHAALGVVGEAPDDAYASDLLERVKLALNSAVEISVPVSDLRPYPDQPRQYFDPESILRLSTAIDATGQTVRGLIRRKKTTTEYELIDGERRWRAIKLIPPERRPLYKADLITADDDVVRYLISGISNFNRDGHTALEITDTIHRLVGFKMSMKTIASLLGISEMWAYQMWGLRNLSPAVRSMLDASIPEKERLGVTAAIQISKIPNPQLQHSLAGRVLRRELPLSQLRSEVVRVATREGVQIRLREQPPYQRFETMMTRSRVARKTVHDVCSAALDPSLATLIRNRTTDRARLIEDVDAMLEELTAYRLELNALT